MRYISTVLVMILTHSCTILGNTVMAMVTSRSTVGVTQNQLEERGYARIRGVL
jgi:hypothetical protein